MPYKDIAKEKEHGRRYYREHSAIIKKRSRKWRELHQEQMKGYYREYRKLHSEQLNINRKKWCTLHPDKNRECKRKWSIENSEKAKTCIKRWQKLHPESRIKANNKLRCTLKGQIDSRMSSGVYQALKCKKCSRKWQSLVDYTWNDLKEHLQSKFTHGMTWQKFMAGEIHIDHMIPKSHFKYESPEDPQFKECWSLHNLQPMWAIENYSKGNRR